MVVVYGIRNCDTVQRACRQLEAAGIAFRFHDFRKDGLSPELARRWVEVLGLDRVVNRKGTTWRGLDEASRAGLTVDTAPALLSAHPSLVKRPVIARGERLHVGFAAAEASAVLDWLRAA